MTTPLNPNIGASGLWSLVAPFDQLISPNVAYSCVAVRLLSDIIAAGGDPFSLYYQPQGLTQNEYQNDVATGTAIVSLQATGGNWVYVPNTYISQMPNANNIPYRGIVLGVNLGALPDSLDLTYVKSQVSAAVQDAIGVVPTAVTSLAVTSKTLISPQEDAAITASRQALIGRNGTPTAQLIAARAQIATLQQQIAALSQYIQSLIDDGTIPGGDIPGGGGGGTEILPTVTATFDPALLPDGMGLADSNMTVMASVNEWLTARTTYGQVSGYFYAEATYDRLTGAVGFGLTNQFGAPVGELGADANSIMMFSNVAKATSGVYYLGAVVNSIGAQPPSQGITVGMAVNLVDALIWFYNPITQQWNGDAPNNQNPVGNIGGISIQSICRHNGQAAQVFPAASTWQVADQATFNPGSSAFVNPMPGGYSPWNTEAGSVSGS
ncbi:DUF7194 family protein [Paraburkholderia adhaesiva]|uniref:DUF7194 family protein n=1 Tax=Paraburkholderia adhaesiva TaxID=2883244 RepID=UPI001F48C0DA|nr:hypothetical protein [Paraburkholderia adhaesiva]